MFDIFKLLNGLSGAGPGADGNMLMSGPAGGPFNSRQHLPFGDQGDFIRSMGQARSSGQVPGQQMSLGMPGGNFNRAMPDPMPFPQQQPSAGPQSAGGGMGAGFKFPDFNSDQFKQRLAGGLSFAAGGNDANDSWARFGTGAQMAGKTPLDQLMILLRHRMGG